MIKTFTSKKFVVPGLAVAAFLAVGTTASAFYPGGFDLAAFDGFSEAEKTAIEKAEEIQRDAREEADAVLEAAGVDREKMQEAFRSYHEGRMEQMDDALESGDYAAFKEEVAGTPLEEKLTEEIFNRLSEAHSLREAGDYEGARAIMEALQDEFDFEGPMMRFGGPHKEMHRNAE